MGCFPAAACPHCSMLTTRSPLMTLVTAKAFHLPEVQEGQLLWPALALRAYCCSPAEADVLFGMQSSPLPSVPSHGTARTASWWCLGSLRLPRTRPSLSRRGRTPTSMPSAMVSFPCAFRQPENLLVDAGCCLTQESCQSLALQQLLQGSAGHSRITTAGHSRITTPGCCNLLMVVISCTCCCRGIACWLYL